MQAHSASIFAIPGRRGRPGAGFLAGVVALATLLPAAAVPLLPGGNVALSGAPGSAGSVIRDSLLPFEIRNGSNQVLISGNVQDRVVRLTGSGMLSFDPWLRDLSATAAGAGFYIIGIKVAGYEDSSTDVEWASNGAGTVGPSSASRDISGGEVTFLYTSGTLTPPALSRFCEIDTNAPAYHLAGRVTITARRGAEIYSTMIDGSAAPTRLQVYSGGVIQAAIDAAAPGETVLVHPGTYTESLVLRAGIDVKGEGAGLVTLRTPSDPGVRIINCADTEFSGFKVIPVGGGSAVTGIQASAGSPLIKNNLVTGFSQRGIYLTGGSTAIVCGNRIQDNGDSGNASLDYGIISLSSKPLITSNLISGNECGCYIAWHDSDGAQFINNTVVGNSSDGLWCYQSNPVVKNNIVSGNAPGINASFGNATPLLTYNNCWGNNGSGNYSAQQTGVINIGVGSLSVDPAFDPAASDLYRLALISPCRDAGDPSFIYNDLDGSRNDMGWTGGPCASPETSAAPFGGFFFTSVGNIPANYIENSGLATVAAGDAAALQIPAWDHAPFGAKPYLFGVFGSGVSPTYYTIECKPGAAPESEFVPLDHPLSKVKFTVTATGITAAVESVGPLSGGVPYYRVTTNGGNTYWANDTLKLILNSAQLPDGTYNLRVKAFDWALTPITLSALSKGLTLTINNRRPTVEIISIARESGALISECGIVGLTGQKENLGFRITANHPDGYLDDYSLVALVGRNRYAGQIAGDSHASNHAGQISWSGVTDTVFNSLPAMTALPPRLSPWESCAYQFRLGAWARTTNGYGRIYYSEFFWNLALNLKGADLDGDGDVDGDDLNLFAEAYGSSNH